MKKLIYLFVFILFISCNQVWSERHKDNFFDQCVMSDYSASLKSPNQEFKKEKIISEGNHFEIL